MVLGAIIGDMVGSRFEFDRGGLTKDFELFTDESTFTDDTVMTVAVAESMRFAMELYGTLDIPDGDMKKAFTSIMPVWGRMFPNAGYGYRFYRWVMGKPTPYGSFGNGSAMRVSSVGWLFDTLKRTRRVARLSAEVSHNHPEGIKGAECTAAVIWMASMGMSKEDIKYYVMQEFGYNLAYSVDEWRQMHKHVETCMDSMPKALAAFLEGDSFEDVIRNAVSLGGDTDTLGAIAGAMAEAMYDIPAELKVECLSRLPEKLRGAVGRLEGLEISETK